MGNSTSLPAGALLASDVAAQLGVTRHRVYQLDHVLCPIFVGRTRVYDRAAVARYCAARDTKKGSR